MHITVPFEQNNFERNGENMKKNNNAFPNNKNSYGTVSGKDSEYAFKNIPQGLSFAFTQNAAAMTAFENMDNAKKRRVLDMASKVNSKKEMHELVQNIAMNNL